MKNERTNIFSNTSDDIAIQEENVTKKVTFKNATDKNITKKVEGERVRKDYSNATPEQKNIHKMQQAETIFKDTVTRIQGAVSNCIAALKDFRPDINFRSLATNPEKHVDVVKKNFKHEVIGLFPTPDVKSGGFYRIHEALREIDSDLEGGVTIDLKEVTKENITDAKENIKYYQDKLEALKIKIKQFEAILANTTIKFNEVKSIRPGYVEDEKFSDRAIKDIKEEIAKVKEKIERIGIDLSEGISMIDYKFENKQ